MLFDVRISSEMWPFPSRLTTGRSTVYSFAASLWQFIEKWKTETNKNILYFPYLNHFRLRPNQLLIFSLNTSSIETGNEHIQGGPLVELEITLPGLKLLEVHQS